MLAAAHALPRHARLQFAQRRCDLGPALQAAVGERLGLGRRHPCQRSVSHRLAECQERPVPAIGCGAGTIETEKLSLT